MKVCFIIARINEIKDRLRELKAVNVYRGLTGKECVEYINLQREKRALKAKLEEKETIK